MSLVWLLWITSSSLSWEAVSHTSVIQLYNNYILYDENSIHQKSINPIILFPHKRNIKNQVKIFSIDLVE